VNEKKRKEREEERKMKGMGDKEYIYI